jgi:hypothetical protein
MEVVIVEVEDIVVVDHKDIVVFDQRGDIDYIVSFL